MSNTLAQISKNPIDALRRRRNWQKMGDSLFGFSPTGTKTATYAAEPWDLVKCNPTGGAFSVTLPAASTATGNPIWIKNVSASTNTITIDADGSETIDGATTKTITTARSSVVLLSDGTEWLVMSHWFGG